jgi:hypothetical protein
MMQRIDARITIILNLGGIALSQDLWDELENQ